MTRLDLAMHNYSPYRYVDPERRSVPDFGSLEALAMDVHRRRSGRALRVIDRQLAWEWGEEQRALVAVEIVEKTGDLADNLLVLTAGEPAEQVRAVLEATRKQAKRAA